MDPSHSRDSSGTVVESSQPSGVGSLRVYLLGEFRVVAGSRAIADQQWKLRKARSLIQLLALAPRHRLHREQLIEHLWPELGAHAAAGNLHQTLYIARRIIDIRPARVTPYLSWQDDVLILCTGGLLWIDVEDFEAAAQAARRSQAVAAYCSALELYRGELLPEDHRSDWLRSRREMLRQSYLGLLGGLAAQYETARQYSQAIKVLQHLLAAEPAHEEAHCCLMRLFALQGDGWQARFQYQALCHALHVEFGVQPGIASRCLHDRILAGRVEALESAAVEYRDNLPRQVAGFAAGLDQQPSIDCSKSGSTGSRLSRIG